MEKLADFSQYDVLHFAVDSDFQEWVLRSVNDAYWKEVMVKHPNKKKEIEKARKLLQSIQFKEKFPSKEQIEQSLENTLAHIEKNKKQTRIYLYKKWWAVAALLIVLMGAGWVTWKAMFLHIPHNQSIIVKQRIQNDKAPGGDKAVLILADGTHIVLDSAGNGFLSQQGNTKITKLENGMLSYDDSGQKPNEVLYNSISTPRGGQYQISLPDGTKVWLNSLSSIRFPTQFVGTERKVEITGVVYFEVTHDATKPFVVQHENSLIHVLGTHFNINGYKDNGKTQVTLLEGIINVATDNRQITIKPAQQAAISDNGSISVSKDINIDEIMAWREGKFIFDKADIHAIMKMLSRWYDIDYEVIGNINNHFGGAISRNVPLSKVVQMLELTGGVRIRIEGDKIFVSSK